MSNRTFAQRFAVVIVLVSAAVTVAGCDFQKQIENGAISYNLAQETAGNEQLLLNVLRSVKRRPMHYTGFTVIRGNLHESMGVDGKATFPSDGSGHNMLDISPNYKWESNPSFEVSVLDSEKFMRGIMTPIDEKRFKYYLDQGFRTDLLLYLFVREVRNKDGSQLHLNYPEDPCKMADFKKWVDDAVRDDFRIEAVTTWAMVGPPLENTPLAGDLAARVLAKKEGFFVVNKAQATALVGDSDKDFLEQLKDLKDTHYVVLKKDSEFVVRTGPRETPNPVGVADKATSDSSISAKKPDTTIVLRSPQAILHYLGELARVQLYGNDRGDRDLVWLPRAGKPDWPLFVVKRTNDARDRGKPEAGAASQPATKPATSVDDAAHDPTTTTAATVPASQPEKSAWSLDQIGQVAVEYDGERFWIPRDNPAAAAPRDRHPSGTSMQALTIVAQLLGLQKSADELPVSRSVTVVGGR